MKNSVKNLVISSIFFGSSFLGISAFAASGEPYSDDWIKGRVSGILEFDRMLTSDQITVESKEGIVTLSGKVPSEADKEYAENLASQLDGVKQIKNNLVADDTIVFKKKSFTERLGDMAVATAVKTKLMASQRVDSSDVSVTSEKGVVTLKGSVPLESSKLAAVDLANSTTGVERVKNELVVKAVESETVAETITDTWISTKVRSVLNFGYNLNGSEIDVTTAKGIVTIGGKAANADQKKLVELAVKDIKGVKAVENNLIVISPR